MNVTGARGNFPLTAVIFGVEVVTIPAVHYAELLRCQTLLAERNINHKQFSKPVRSPIERDSEVAIFFAMRLGTSPVSAIIESCRREFGSKRTPSKSAVHRYWERVRLSISQGP